MKSRNILQVCSDKRGEYGENIVTTNFIYESEASEKGPPGYPRPMRRIW